MFLRFLGATAALGFLSLTACSGGGTNASDSTSGWTLSGSMSVSSSSLFSMDVKPSNWRSEMASKALEMFAEDGVSTASACSDGNFYRVLCTSWSVPPTVAYGDVSCSGSTGSFSVAGLPADTEISCFVRKSADNVTFKPFGTIELPAQGLGGSTDVLSANGNIGVSVSVDSTGTITATVNSGTNKSEDAVSTKSPTATTMNGFYKLSCDTATDSDTLAKCKCFLFNQGTYQTDDACLAAKGAAISASTSAMNIDLNLYNATISQDISEDGKVILPAGTTAQGVTVWGATCTGSTASTCTSDRGTGGEGLSNQTGLTWASTQATNAVAWKNSGSATIDGLTFTAASLPSNSATAGTWYNYVKDMIPSGFTCSWGPGNTLTGTSAAAHAWCVGEFAEKYLGKENSGYNFPRVRIDIKCSANSACDDTVMANVMVNVEGLHFDYPSNDTDFSDNTPTGMNFGASPRNRYVFEQWMPSTNGGGFKQKHSEKRWYACNTTGSSGAVSNTACTGANDGVECFMNEEMGIKFTATATTGTYTLGFNKVNTVFGGTYRSSNSTLNGQNAYSACLDKAGASGGQFFVKGVKYQ